MTFSYRYIMYFYHINPPLHTLVSTHLIYFLSLTIPSFTPLLSSVTFLRDEGLVTGDGHHTSRTKENVSPSFSNN